MNSNEYETDGVVVLTCSMMFSSFIFRVNSFLRNYCYYNQKLGDVDHNNNNNKNSNNNDNDDDNENDFCHLYYRNYEDQYADYFNRYAKTLLR